MTGLDARLDETGSLPDVPARDATQVSSSAGAKAGDDGNLPALGAVVGNYRLLEVIGSGGMGRVYKAEHTLLGKKVALKMLRRRYAENPDAVQRFFSEARAVTSIEHDNLVDVTDFVETPDWPPCFVMQLLRGRSLLRAIRDDGPFPVPRLLSVAAQTASAVAAVHAASIIHRDLKPANIFLAQHRGGGEVVKLLDFGVAKLLDEQGVSMHDTNAGVPVGTPDYMAPEQVTGSARIDFRVDIWALGAVLYEAATGRLPYQASSFGELVLALLSRDVVPPNELRAGREPLPKSLELLILQCLSRVAAQRPSSMKEVHERLLALAAPYGLPFLDGAPLLLAETDPGAGVSALTGPLRFGEAAVSTMGLDDDAPSVGPPTRDIPGALPERRLPRWALPSIAAALVVLGVVGVGVWRDVASRGVGAGEGTAERPSEAAVESAAAVEMVTVSFASTPPGASVFHEGSAEPIGQTPFELQVPRGREALRFDVRLDGHAPGVAVVTPDRAQTIQSSLAPLTSAPATTEPRRERPRKQRPQPGAQAPADKAGLIDVF